MSIWGGNGGKWEQGGVKAMKMCAGGPVGKLLINLMNRGCTPCSGFSTIVSTPTIITITTTTTTILSVSKEFIVLTLSLTHSYSGNAL